MRMAVILMMTAVFASGCGNGPTGSHADLILTGGHVLTQTDTPFPTPPTAVAMAAGKILYVGSDDQALQTKGPETRVVDLKGATVIPGLVDSHCHLYGLGKSLAQIDLMGTGSPEQILEIVGRDAVKFAADSWIEGRGWDQNDWEIKEYPHRRMLDGIIADRPVLLRRVDGHAAWVNSEALRRASITRDTPDPEGGEILRDEQGEPTGILIDNAGALVSEKIPDIGAEETRRRIKLAIDHCVAHGLTGVHEAGVKWERAQVYRDMAAAGDLDLRVYAMYDDLPATLEKAYAEGPVFTDDGMLTIRAIKLYADGALGSRGALLLENYSDRPDHRGLPVTPPDHMREVMAKGGRAGFQICTHAIGDGANRLVLDLCEEVLAELNLEDARWRVEHAQILDPADIPRFGELGVIAAMQPVHCTSDMDWADERLGAERLAGAYAWRSLLDSGAHLCYGTDFPVEKVNPLAGLYSAVTRTHPDGTPIGGWQPQEAVDAATALELYTAGSAFAGFRENESGRVAENHQADLTILDGNPVTCAPADLLTMKVMMTIVNGRVVYENP
ncbi:MAG: amidohydrolase [Candidatus Krumholzibacteriota bacterium]